MKTEKNILFAFLLNLAFSVFELFAVSKFSKLIAVEENCGSIDALRKLHL